VLGTEEKRWEHQDSSRLQRKNVEKNERDRKTIKKGSKEHRHPHYLIVEEENFGLHQEPGGKRWNMSER